MKTFTAAIVCFSLMLTGLFVYLNYTKKACDELLGELDGVLESAYIKDMEKTEEAINKFMKKWDEKRKILSIFSDSAINDVITENITAMKYFARLSDDKEVVSRAGVLKEFIENIYRLEKPSLQNIL